MDIKKYNIIFTDMAKQDLKEIYNYIFEKLAEPQIEKNRGKNNSIKWWAVSMYGDTYKI